VTDRHLRPWASPLGRLLGRFGGREDATGVPLPSAVPSASGSTGVPSSPALAGIALQANADLLLILANRGLISPDDVTSISEGLMERIRRSPQYLEPEMLEAMATLVDSMVSGTIALAADAARVRWRDV
jgi:hypothetical protein